MSPVRILLAITLLGAVLADIPDPVHNTTLWDLVLTQYVTPNQTIEGITLNVVDYIGIANDSNFKAFKEQFAYVDIASLNRSEFYAFLINVYNVFAIDMIISHACRNDIFGNCGALHSIEDIGTWIPHNPVWGMTAGTVGNKTYSLDDIETMLRKPTSFGFTEDSRLHAAIVCASVSCPNVRREAYKPDIIDQQLTENFNDFMSNTGKGMHVDKTNNVVTLSAIFSWFESDFTESTVVANITDANPIDFILYYLSKNYSDYAWLAQNAHSVTIRHFVYNWRVNAKDGVPCSHKSRPCYTIFALVITLVLFAVIVLVFSTIYLLAKRRRKVHRHSKKEYKALTS